MPLNTCDKVFTPAIPTRSCKMPTTMSIVNPRKWFRTEAQSQCKHNCTQSPYPSPARENGATRKSAKTHQRPPAQRQSEFVCEDLQRPATTCPNDYAPSSPRSIGDCHLGPATYTNCMPRRSRAHQPTANQRLATRTCKPATFLHTICKGTKRLSH